MVSFYGDDTYLIVDMGSSQEIGSFFIMNNYYSKLNTVDGSVLDGYVTVGDS